MSSHANSAYSSELIGLLIEDEPRSGVDNMRIDDLLLEQAMCEAPQRRLIEEHSFHQPLVLRIYRWSEPTLSLGHFQRVEDLALAADTHANPQLREIPWVKRKTGGGAILHDLELTYSIIVPATWSFQAGTVRTLPDRSGSFDPSKGHSEGLYRAVHDSVVSGLIELGISASLSESCTCKVAGRESTEGEPFLCFHRRTPVDVVVGEHKVLGSAQRRSRFGLLQHGSLLIRSSGQYPALKGVQDLVSVGSPLPKDHHSSVDFLPTASGLTNPIGDEIYQKNRRFDHNFNCDFDWSEWLKVRLCRAIDHMTPVSWEKAQLKPRGRWDII